MTAPQVVDLWPGKAAGDVGIDIKNDERKRKEVWGKGMPGKVGMGTTTTTPAELPKLGEEYAFMLQASTFAGPTKLVTNVSRPTLTIYPPPKDRNTGAALLICPGGGYHDLFWELEGEEVAAWAAAQGMTAIILKFRVPRRPGDPGYDAPSPPAPPGPLLDAQRAISMVRSRSAELGIDPKKIGIVGFSAGGHLAVMSALTFAQRAYQPLDAIDQVSCRPDFAISCYGGYFKAKDTDELAPGIRIPADAPPILLAVSGDDMPEHSLFMYLGLKRAGIPAELHIYANGGHSFGVRQNEKLPSSWTGLCVNWLRNLGMLGDVRSTTHRA